MEMLEHNASAYHQLEQFINKSDLINASALDCVLEQIEMYHEMDGDQRMYSISDFRNILKQQNRIKTYNLQTGHWIIVDSEGLPAYDCSICNAMCYKKHLFCPKCKSLMSETFQ